MFLFYNTKEEIQTLANNYIDAILSSEDYTFLLFLFNVSVFN